MKSFMKPVLAAVFSGVVMMSPAWAAGDDEERITLKDGTVLLINPKGEMRMIDIKGHTMSMKDGVAMETEDGEVIMMMNERLWRQHKHKVPGR